MRIPLKHRIAHFFGWNTGCVVSWWQQEGDDSVAYIGFQCAACGVVTGERVRAKLTKAQREVYESLIEPPHSHSQVQQHGREMKKKLTLKNFGLGLAVIVGFPIWLPIVALVTLIAATCEIGREIAGFLDAE